MEIIGIIDVLHLCWIEFGFQRPEIIFGKFCCIFSCECFFNWMLETLFILSVDGLTSGFGKTLAKKIFTGYLWNITGISRDVLSFYVLCWSSNPVYTLHWIISILQLIIFSILSWWVNMTVVLLILGFTNGNVDIVLAWFLSSLIDQFINIARCAT